MNAKERLNDIVYAGLGPDIYLAERAREIHRAIGSNADDVNRAGFGELFGAIQNAAVGELTLSVSKLFERDSDRYPVRSIPAAIGTLRRYAADLIPVQPSAALVDFERAGIDTSPLTSLSASEYNAKLADLLEASCPDPKRAAACVPSRSLEILRASRDKEIAHNEAIDREDLPRAKWSEAEALLQYAKNVTAGLAMAYFSSAWTDDQGKFSRSDDAQVAGSQLRRLLAKTGIVQKLPSNDR